MIYEFDQFRLDADRFELTNATGEVVELMPLTMDLLLVLVRSPSVLISKETIMQEVWQGVPVSDTALPYQVRTLRMALGDTEKPFRVVETIHGKGLRMAAEVTTVGASSSTPSPEENGEAGSTHPEVPPSTHPAKPKLSRPVLIASILAALAALIGVVSVTNVFSSGTSQAAEYNASVAVMPFREIGLEEGNQYLGEGLAVELTSVLSRVEGLKVPASASAFRLANAEATPFSKISETLGVSYVIDGSVQRQGDTIRVAVQLVSASDNSTVWSQTYNRPFNADNFLRIQDEIVNAVVAQVLPNLDLGDIEQDGFTPSTQALDLVLQADQQLRDRSDASLLKAIELLERAVEIDPDYGEAYAKLAYAIQTGFFAGALPREVAQPKRAQALAKAQELAPNNPITLLTLGLYALSDGENTEANGLLQRALAQAPQNIEILAALAQGQRVLGRNEERRALLQRARSIDPLNPNILNELADAEYTLGSVEAATEVARTNMKWNPSSGDAKSSLANMLSRVGDYKQSHSLMISALQDNPRSFRYAEHAELIYSRVGWDDRAQSVVSAIAPLKAELAARQGDRETVEIYIEAQRAGNKWSDTFGVVHFYLRDFHKALPELQRAVVVYEVTGPAPLGLHEIRWHIPYAHVLIDGGDPDGEVVLRKIEEAVANVTPETAVSYDQFIAAAGARMLRGDEAGAMDWLEAAVDDGHVFLHLVPGHPTFEPLADNPRYQALEKRMKVRANRLRTTFEEQIGASAI